MQPDPQRQQDITPAKVLARSPVASVRTQVETDEQAYAVARRVAVLAVIEALFDEVFCTEEDEWCKQIASVLAAFKQQTDRPPFAEAWAIALAEYPPPTDWLPRTTREREALAANGYVPMRRVNEGDRPLVFAFRVMRDAYAA